MKSIPTTMMGTRTSSMSGFLPCGLGLHRGKRGIDLFGGFEFGDLFFERLWLSGQGGGIGTPLGQIGAPLEQFEARESILRTFSGIGFPDPQFAVRSFGARRNC